MSVFWNVTSLNGTNASLDLDTLSGIVHFSEGQSMRLLNISIKPDVVSNVFTGLLLFHSTFALVCRL